MRRSVIEQSIATAMETFDKHGLRLPPFAYWTVADWQQMDANADEIRECMLGWDVTDFGLGDFVNIGRTLFTARNGLPDSSRFPKMYAEKYILNPLGQRAPAHYHKSKTEDIINRGGGTMLVQAWIKGSDNKISDDKFALQVNGITRKCKAGEIIELEPGESVCLSPGMIHQFWCGKGMAVSSEVSSVSNDHLDNVFFDDRCQRFPPVEEDVKGTFVLVNEYAKIEQLA